MSQPQRTPAMIHSSLSRRSFFRAAAAASAVSALPMFTEPQLAHAQRAIAAPRLHAFIPASAVHGQPVHIDANENPLGPCTAACAAISSLISEGGRYDVDLTARLISTFAATEGLQPENILAYAGSSEPLHYTVLAFTSPTQPYVTADPGYEAGMRAAEARGTQVFKVPLTAEHAHDVRAMVSVAPNAGVIYICNPNNPSGTITSREDIKYALEHKPKGSVLLIDEAYIHFSDATPSLDLVKAGKDVIVLRTFSKLYGMAGVRCGFAIARPDLLARLAYFGANAMPIMSVAAAAASLEDKTIIAARKKINADLRSETFAWLTANNYNFIPSQTNCFMLNTGRPGKQVMAAMAEHGVYIGRVWPIMPTYVRITVGTGDEMEKFQAAYKTVMSNPAVSTQLDSSHNAGAGGQRHNILS